MIQYYLQLRQNILRNNEYSAYNNHFEVVIQHDMQLWLQANEHVLKQ